MLVGTFQVQVGRLAEATRGEHAFMGHARIEPDVEDVGDLLVVGGFSAQQFGGIQRVPHVDALGFDAVGDLLHQLHRTRMDLAGLPVVNSAIGTPQVRWREMVQSGTSTMLWMRAFPQVGNQPTVSMAASASLRRLALSIEMNHCVGGAEHHRRLVAPAVRVAVADRMERQQRTVVAQHADDGLLRLPQVLAGQHHVTGRRGRFQVHATTVDRGHLAGVVLVQQVLLADHEVFLAVAGAVCRTGTVLVGDVVAVGKYQDPRAPVERVRQQLVLQRRAGGFTVQYHVLTP